MTQPSSSSSSSSPSTIIGHLTRLEEAARDLASGSLEIASEADRAREAACGSTLRLTLGCLLAEQLGIQLRRVGSGARVT